MSQQINLLGAAFRKQRQTLSAVNAAQALAVVMLALFAFQVLRPSANQRT